MLLRTSLDRVVPEKKGEQKLTQGRRFVFRGSYALTKEITGVETVYAPSYLNFPYYHPVTRKTIFDKDVTSGDANEWNSYSYAYSDDWVVAELNRPETLNRANRIERIARYIKGGIAVSLMSGVAAFGAMKESLDTSNTKQTTHVAGSELLQIK
jgi:hypothetical protein